MATAQTAPNQTITAPNGITYAYRRLGPSSGTPLVMLMHFRGNMDFWDPLLLNQLCTQRPVITFDNAGIGASTGTVPPTVRGWAAHAIAFVRALGLARIDLLGFSMGGMAAQMVALDEPGLVRRLVLCGTRASQSASSVENSDPRPGKLLTVMKSGEEAEAAIRETFFVGDEEGAEAARRFWARLAEREGERVGLLGFEGTRMQLKALKEWGVENEGNSARRLGELTMPVLVANGDADVIIPTQNSWELMKGIRRAYLHIYPRAGHGFLFQYAELFARHVQLFLDAEEWKGGSKL